MVAAGRAIATHGLLGLTLATVAQEAGVSPATLVQRFGSKRGLLLAFAERAPAAARAPFTRARRLHDSPLAALRAAIVGAARIRSRAELANHLTFLHMDLTDPDFITHARQHVRVMRQEIAALVTDAVATGELHPDAEPDRLAHAVLVAYHGSLVTWALSDDGSLPDAVRGALDTLLTPYLKEKT